MTRDRRIGSLMASRAIDTPDTHCQTHGVPFDENRRCSACLAALWDELLLDPPEDDPELDEHYGPCCDKGACDE